MDEFHPSQSLRTVHTYGGSSRCSRSLLTMASLLNLLSTRPPPLFGICTNPPSKKYTFGAQIPFLTFRSASNSQKSSHRPAGSEGIDETTSQVSRRSALAAVVAGMLCGKTAINTPSACGSEEKKTNLNVEQVKAIIEDDIRKGQYYVTGNLSPSIYNDNCRFTDPTTVVTGVQKYVAAVKLLFDPDLSQQELISIDVVGPHTIEANWRLGGYLKFPWKPHIMPYEGSTRYTLGDDGLVVSHDEKWSISLLTALLELFTPSWGPH